MIRPFLGWREPEGVKSVFRQVLSTAVRACHGHNDHLPLGATGWGQFRDQSGLDKAQEGFCSLEWGAWATARGDGTGRGSCPESRALPFPGASQLSPWQGCTAGLYSRAPAQGPRSFFPGSLRIPAQAGPFSLCGRVLLPEGMAGWPHSALAGDPDSSCLLVWALREP